MNPLLHRINKLEAKQGPQTGELSFAYIPEKDDGTKPRKDPASREPKRASCNGVQLIREENETIADFYGRMRTIFKRGGCAIVIKG